MTARDWPHVPCLDDDPEMFHPTSSQLQQIEDAKAVCRRCPVMFACKAEAMADSSITGIWGATTEDERANLRRRRKRKSQSRASA